MNDLPNGATIKYVNIGQQCEAGLFDRSFMCESTKTKRVQSRTCVVWLCDDHVDVVTIPITATE